MEQESGHNEADVSVDASAKSLAIEQNNEAPAEAASKLLSSGVNQDNNADVAGESDVKAESSKKRTLKLLKAKSNINKRPVVEGSSQADQFRGRNRKRRNKGAFKGKRENGNNVSENNKNEIVKGSKSEQNGLNEAGRNSQNNREKDAGSSRSQPDSKSEEKGKRKDKSSQKQMNKDKLHSKENNKGNEKKKEKLGGLIFMCNAKTKPDCFRYQVMGVTSNKKDLVLGVKPGLRLFLYDFDLRLMYGIYKASSSGGMRLEPKAFGGSFPAQVRFMIDKDCIPLPENVFKKAIKDNYDKNNKFDIELSVRQVRKLSELFRPVAFPTVKPIVVPVHSTPLVTIPSRESYDKPRDSRVHSDRQPLLRVNNDVWSYSTISHERDHRIEHREVIAPPREEAPHDLFMSEKEYRTYGLQRERRNLTPPRSVPSTLDSYSRSLDREHFLIQAVPSYDDAVPARRELVLEDYPTQRELQAYDIGVRRELLPAVVSVSAMPSSSAVTVSDPYRRDPYYSYQHGTSAASSYLQPPKRDEVFVSPYYIDGRRDTNLGGSDLMHRRESEPVDRLYLKYGGEPSADFSEQVYQRTKSEAALIPSLVSSRYSFAGPSASYR